LCGRWFCEKHIKPRTFLIRGIDVQEEQIPGGTGLDEVPVDPPMEQGSLMFGTAPNWINEQAGWMMDRLRSRKGQHRQSKHEDTHPDFQYTREVLGKLTLEDGRRSELMKRAIGRMNRYYSRERLQAVNLKREESRDKAECEEKLQAERHFPAKEVALLLVLLALAIVFWYALR
jgi:hypothetical protein